MILDGSLGASRDEHQSIGAGGECLVDRVLNERLVDDRQHFLRARFGDRKEPRAASGYGKHDSFDGLVWDEEMITDFLRTDRKSTLLNSVTTTSRMPS